MKRLVAVWGVLIGLVVGLSIYLSKEDPQGNEFVQLFISPDVELNVDVVLDDLEKTRKLAEQLFQAPFDEWKAVPIHVVSPFDEAYTYVENSAGVYLPESEQIYIDGTLDLHVQRTIIHEYSHYLFDKYLKMHFSQIEQVPLWFVEGVAEYMMFYVEGARPIRDEYTYAVMPFTQLLYEDELNSEAIYYQGFYAVHHLVETYGEQSIVELVESFIKTSSLRTAFESVTGLNYDTYHELFRFNQNFVNDVVNASEAKLVLEKGEQLMRNLAMVNQYTPFVMPKMVEAALQLQDVELAKVYTERLRLFISEPTQYLTMIELFLAAEEVEYAVELIEEARYFAKRYNYDLKFFENEVEKLNNKWNLFS